MTRALGILLVLSFGCGRTEAPQPSPTTKPAKHAATDSDSVTAADSVAATDSVTAADSVAATDSVTDSVAATDSVTVTDSVTAAATDPVEPGPRGDDGDALDAPVHLTDELPPDVQRALAYDPDDPLGDLEAADVLDRRAGAVAEAGPVPSRGCAVAIGPARVWPRPGPVAVAPIGADFLVSGYDRRDGREQVYVVQVSATGLPRPIAALPLETAQLRDRRVPPGLAARDAAHATLAATDGAGNLLVATVRVSGGAAAGFETIARGVDPRFAPAVAHTADRTLVAWTEGSTPMRTFLARLDRNGAVLARDDVTPASMGAAAPTFVAGAMPPRLLFVDARQGVSPVVGVEIDVDASPRPGVVALVVSSLAAPPALAAAGSGGTTWLGYTGLGNAATSAIGLVRLAPPGDGPRPLVPGTAYGPLHVSAAGGERNVVFAADAPTRPGKDAPRRIVVHVVDDAGPGPALALEAPGGSASHAAVARAEGVVAVAYESESGIYLTRLRCDGS